MNTVKTEVDDESDNNTAQEEIKADLQEDASISDVPIESVECDLDSSSYVLIHSNEEHESYSEVQNDTIVSDSNASDKTSEDDQPIILIDVETEIEGTNEGVLGGSVNDMQNEAVEADDDYPDATANKHMSGDSVKTDSINHDDVVQRESCIGIQSEAVDPESIPSIVINDCDGIQTATDDNDDKIPPENLESECGITEDAVEYDRGAITEEVVETDRLDDASVTDDRDNSIAPNTGTPGETAERDLGTSDNEIRIEYAESNEIAKDESSTDIQDHSFETIECDQESLTNAIKAHFNDRCDVEDDEPDTCKQNEHTESQENVLQEPAKDCDQTVKIENGDELGADDGNERIASALHNDQPANTDVNLGPADSKSNDAGDIVSITDISVDHEKPSENPHSLSQALSSAGSIKASTRINLHHSSAEIIEIADHHGSSVEFIIRTESIDNNPDNEYEVVEYYSGTMSNAAFSNQAPEYDGDISNAAIECDGDISNTAECEGELNNLEIECDGNVSNVAAENDDETHEHNIQVEQSQIAHTEVVQPSENRIDRLESSTEILENIPNESNSKAGSKDSHSKEQDGGPKSKSEKRLNTDNEESLSDKCRRILCCGSKRYSKRDDQYAPSPVAKES